jgi:hypothetical protein
MIEPRSFFIPGYPADQQEDAYARLAAWCDRPIPAKGKRISSITYGHNGEEWIATVGEVLRGIRRKVTRRKRGRTEHEIPLSDPAGVLAIFEGRPFMVVTNKGVGEVRSSWENPFMAGDIRGIEYFG